MSINLSYPEVVAMSVAEFRKFKRAVLVLVRSGVHFNNAVVILLDARRERLQRQ